MVTHQRPVHAQHAGGPHEMRAGPLCTHDTKAVKALLQIRQARVQVKPWVRGGCIGALQ